MALLTCLQPVAIGGVFLIQQGKAKLHIMVRACAATATQFAQPDFAEEPLLSEAEVSQWLKYFFVDAPLTCLSVFVTTDPVRAARATPP